MFEFQFLDMRLYHEYLTYYTYLQDYISGQRAGRAAAANKKKL